MRKRLYRICFGARMPRALCRLCARLTIIRLDHHLKLFVKLRLRAGTVFPGITITILFGFLPIILALVQRLASRAGGILPSDLTTVFLLALLLMPVLLAVFLGGWVALWSASPSAYAKIVISGRPAGDIFHIIGRHIQRALWDVVCTIKPYVELTGDHYDSAARPWRRSPKEDPGGAKNGDDRGEQPGVFVTLKSGKEDKMEALCKRLDKLLERQHKLLGRIEAMKMAASHELGIPHRRLCDHIFQYSPQIHRDRLQKFSEGLRTMQSMSNKEQEAAGSSDEEGGEERTSTESEGDSNCSEAGEMEDGSGRVGEGDAYIRNTLKRIHFQAELLRHSDLHEMIKELASRHSSSGALRIYCRALQCLAKGADGRNSAKGNERATVALEDRLRFILRKQRAHPGFDLHKLLIQAVKVIFGEKAVDREFSLLKAMDEARATANRDGAGESSVGAEVPTRLLSATGLKGLDALGHLDTELSKHMEDAQPKLEANFCEVWTKWCGSTKGYNYFVTHGYSKTVRNVLLGSRDVLSGRDSTGEQGSANGRREENGQSPAGAEIANGEPKTKLFFVLPDVGGPTDESLDTRIMEYELKQSPTFRHQRDVAAGSSELLLNLVEPGDRVFVALGAECFDKDRQVVHARGMVRDLQFLTEALEARQIPCMVVIVAESYKRTEKTLPQESIFYSQHFDRIDLYPARLIHLIVTEVGTEPLGWETIVRSRSRNAPARTFRNRTAACWRRNVRR